jgi:asparagine synthase (glutamine-hydrolysing)
MPGHTIEVQENGALRIEPYWDLNVDTDPQAQSLTDYVHQYRGLLEQSVGRHMMSDVPLGVFLSGGLDSSAVAALMTKHRGAPVDTFSVGYPEQGYSELPYARTVAKHLNSIHYEVTLTSREFFDALPKLIWHEDEPLAWPSSVSLYFVAQLARQHVKVVLTGEGSDETLGGYSRYSFTMKNVAMDHLYCTLTPSAFRARLRRAIGDSPWLSAALRRKLSHTFLALDSDSWESFYFDNFFSAFGAEDQNDLLTEHTRQEFAGISGYSNVMAAWNRSSGELLQRLLYTDIKTYLVELLMKQDNMSMAASIESRVPFLDHELVEFATKIPANLQLRGNSGKQILKKAMEGLLPQSIIYRPKLGFPTPWSGWLAGPQLGIIEALLLEERSLGRGFFKTDSVKRIFAEHRGRYRDHYDRIWRLLNLELWHRVCLEGESGNASAMDPSEARLVSSIN